MTALTGGRPGHDQEGPLLRAQVCQSPRRLGGGRPPPPPASGKQTCEPRARLPAHERNVHASPGRRSAGEERSRMTGYPTLSAEMTNSFVSLWTQYAGKPPTDARTEIHGNVVTCVLADARRRLQPEHDRSADRRHRRWRRQAHLGRLQAGRRRRGREADPSARSLVHEQPRQRHGRRHRGIHPGAILRPRGVPGGEAIRKRLLASPTAGLTGDLAMDTGTTKAPSGGLNLRLVELEAEARHARERYRLYRAKAYGSRLTSEGRLRELERQSKFAQRRLDRAKAESDPNRCQ